MPHLHIDCPDPTHNLVLTAFSTSGTYYPTFELTDAYVKAFLMISGSPDPVAWSLDPPATVNEANTHWVVNFRITAQTGDQFVLGAYLYSDAACTHQVGASDNNVPITITDHNGVVCT